MSESTQSAFSALAHLAMSTPLGRYTRIAHTKKEGILPSSSTCIIHRPSRGRGIFRLIDNQIIDRNVQSGCQSLGNIRAWNPSGLRLQFHDGCRRDASIFCQPLNGQPSTFAPVLQRISQVIHIWHRHLQTSAKKRYLLDIAYLHYHNTCSFPLQSISKNVAYLLLICYTGISKKDKKIARNRGQLKIVHLLRPAWNPLSSRLKRLCVYYSLQVCLNQANLFNLTTIRSKSSNLLKWTTTCSNWLLFGRQIDTWAARRDLPPMAGHSPAHTLSASATYFAEVVA